MKPNRENIRAWVAALRSGQYAQVRGELKGRGGGYCCLGVACSVYQAMTGKGEWVGLANVFRIDKQDTSSSSAYLPPAVKDWLGVDGDNPRVQGHFLAVLNDQGATFADIADRIEREFLSSDDDQAKVR